MPCSNYGNAVKQRAIQFFTVLVDYANDELDVAIGFSLKVNYLRLKLVYINNLQIRSMNGNKIDFRLVCRNVNS